MKTYAHTFLKKIDAVVFKFLFFCICLSFSFLRSYAADYDFLSGEYKNQSIIIDYVNELQYTIPSRWVAETTSNEGKITRSYTVKTGTVLSIIYMPVQNSWDITGNYTYVNSVVNSIINGMTEYTEISRSEGAIGNYPSVVIAYTWVADNGSKIWSCSLCTCTNQGVYTMTFMISENNMDKDLFEDMLMYTFQNSNIISFSDSNIIKDVQEKLVVLGYDCGTPDGIMGAETKSAIDAYRRDNNLAGGDGIDGDFLSSINNNVSNIERENVSSNPLLAAEVFTAPVKSGDNSRVLGTYAYINLPKNVLKTISEKQFTEFAQKVVNGSGYNWVSIICEDGTGICFSGSDIYYPTYGKLDTDGAITDGYGDITWNFGTNSYSYTTRS